MGKRKDVLRKSLKMLLLLWVLLPVQMAFSDELILKTSIDRHVVQIELADTPEKRTRGLMHRTEMDADAGMLFDFKLEKRVAMWMKNTLIGLDMLFAKEDGTIIFIKENANPGDLTTIMPDEPVRWVLELNAGYVKRNQVRTGDRLIFPPQ
ncbi:DUF192 domain-containing protein [Sneathiella limimaris]|uniref:DUF192 domain-containing protein n=1 Tax=Sneathiella limimaris TaxID=1964213 RepID=UPI001469BCEB|nr:DUF192 domain-containing protein [Sneathiella limimaris]